MNTVAWSLGRMQRIHEPRRRFSGGPASLGVLL
ncbi:hypothetical protein DFR24_4515 [Panacagrimonas perspica]|uniref:Uncharacterized protein n=1 Tax=Panacagrimonas perspica TaxID=381431 RepID=A0A4R7NUT1_9GAMM|nr:hypothetical protein DFR24_4515 [Panacagrimonas perspica]